MKSPRIKSVTALEKYMLHVVFEDGAEGNYNVSNLAGKGVFKTWDADNSFSKVFISARSGAITWPGELDIDSINVYCSISHIKVEDYLTGTHHAAY